MSNPVPHFEGLLRSSFYRLLSSTLARVPHPRRGPHPSGWVSTVGLGKRAHSSHSLQGLPTALELGRPPTLTKTSPDAISALPH